MKQLRLVLYLLALIFAFGSVAQAQDKGSEPTAVELKKTVVTATRTETPIENIPVSVTVITKDDIEKMHAKTVDDVLNKVAGVQVKRGRRVLTGSHVSVKMRGTGSASRMLVLKDGIPLNDSYTGGINLWGSLSVEDIEKIEIVRGASSALYGSSAMGGVINIITRPARKKIAGSVSLEGGTFDTYIGNARFSSATDKYGIRCSAGHKRTDGYEYYEGDKWKDYYKKEEVKITNVSLGGDIWLGESLLKLDYEYYMRDSLYATTNQYDGENKHNHYTLGYNIPIGKTDLSIKTYFFDSDSDSQSHKYNSTTGSHDRWNYDTDSAKDTLGLIMQLNRELGRHRLTIGSDSKWGEIEYKYTYPTGLRTHAGKQDIYSLFVNDEVLIGDKLILSAGLRYDHWKSHGGSYYDETTGTVRSTKYPERTDDAWCPKAGVVYKLRENTKLRASFGTGFRVPGLYYLYRTAPHGATFFNLSNPDLGPEKMPWSYDVGFDMKPNDNLSLTFTFYQSQFKDFLASKTVPPGEVPPELGIDPGVRVAQPVNVGKVDIYGAEAGLEYRFNNRWSAFVNHTYNVSKIKEYEEKPEVVGNYLSGSPRHITKVGFTYDNPDLFTLSVYLRNVGPSFGDLENTDKKKVEGFHVVDMKVSRELFNGIELFLSADNLLDEKYKESYSYYSPPFMAMVGVKYTF